MSFSLLQFLIKIANFIVVLFASLTSNLKIAVNTYEEEKGINEIKTVVEYKTVYKYSSKLPYNTSKVITEGVDGLKYISNGEEKTLVEKVDEVVLVGTGRYGEFTGALTEYGPDCVGCDPNGYTFCRTKKGNWHSLTKDGITYEDSEYGTVRILAAYTGVFPCGTIIEINNSDRKNVIGIVLDTGGGMITAYRNGWTLLDIAYESQSKTEFGINKKTSFSVKRWGW